jgi:hypothetical protein
MISQTIRAALAATAFAVSAAPAAQAAAFDGPWSVVVITTRGPCDQSYRYGVMIRGGNVTYLGGGAVYVSGRVNPSGQVNVSVSAGGQSAYGSGRLSNGRGGGKWSGAGPQGACSGTWSASQG